MPCIRQSATNVEEAQDVRWIKESKAKHAAGIQNQYTRALLMAIVEGRCIMSGYCED